MVDEDKCKILLLTQRPATAPARAPVQVRSSRVWQQQHKPAAGAAASPGGRMCVTSTSAMLDYDKLSFYMIHYDRKMLDTQHRLLSECASATRATP
jgi:hypothetical protein